MMGAIDEVTCKELIGFLLAYLSGELPEERQRAFEEHLKICPPCVAYLKRYQQVMKITRAVEGDPLDSPPPELDEVLVRAILSSRPREDRTP
ncbi:MAG: zf-HC2 domain-containing protein [Planctomycetota bacterium]